MLELIIGDADWGMIVALIIMFGLCLALVTGYIYWLTGPHE